ncbi:(2Fe-2S)-binding protein [Rhizorhabdus dicambivorans]|nr:(2Fe-2S)-binding protein [Rhizorhabdus dicambivorans]
MARAWSAFISGERRALSHPQIELSQPSHSASPVIEVGKKIYLKRPVAVRILESSMNQLDPSHPFARAPGRSYQELLDEDTRHKIPDALRFQNPVDLGVEPVRAERYHSPDFFRKEVDKVFLKTWQYAVHEDELPNVGDTYVFDLLHKTVLITRQEDGSLKAMQNVCLHRGRKLVTHGGCKRQFRCPFHGMEWNIDGTFKWNPIGWDFPQIAEKEFSLPEVRLESWMGFVFINFDPNATPFADLVGVLPDHMEHWKLRDCYKGAHVGKIVRANWKVVAEAFMEGYHVYATHPQANPFIAVEQGQYDLITDHVSRFTTAVGIPTELLEEKDMSEERRIELMLGAGSRANKPFTKESQPQLAAEETTRTHMAERGRRMLQEQTGRDFSEACDADILDGISYHIFPNFHIWGAFPQKICYRMRPIDPDTTLWEAMMIRIAPKDGPRPAPGVFRMLKEDEPWSTVIDELGYLATLYDQDMGNMQPCQDGLKALGDGVVQFAHYSETALRNLHRMIDKYINDEI